MLDQDGGHGPKSLGLAAVQDRLGEVGLRCSYGGNQQYAANRATGFTQTVDWSCISDAVQWNACTDIERALSRISTVDPVILEMIGDVLSTRGQAELSEGQEQLRVTVLLSPCSLSDAWCPDEIRI